MLEKQWWFQQPIKHHQQMVEGRDGWNMRGLSKHVGKKMKIPVNIAINWERISFGGLDDNIICVMIHQEAKHRL